MWLLTIFNYWIIIIIGLFFHYKYFLAKQHEPTDDKKDKKSKNLNIAVILTVIDESSYDLFFHAAFLNITTANSTRFGPRNNNNSQLNIGFNQFRLSRKDSLTYFENIDSITCTRDGINNINSEDKERLERLQRRNISNINVESDQETADFHNYHYSIQRLNSFLSSMYTSTGRGNGNRNSGANLLLKLSHPPSKASTAGHKGNEIDSFDVQTFRNYHAEYGVMEWKCFEMYQENKKQANKNSKIKTKRKIKNDDLY